MSRPVPGRSIAQGQSLAQEQATQEVARFHAQLLDAVGQAVIATDLDGTITYWNRAAELLYGWTAAEVLGRHIVDLTTPAPDRHQAAEIMACVQRGETWSGEFSVRRRDGTSFPALVTDSPVRDANGQIVGVVGVSTDLTERERLLAAERLARAEAEAAVRVRDRVLTAIAHDAKTPLTAIRGYAQLLARSLRQLDLTLASADQRQRLDSCVGEIVSAVAKMTRWLDELSDLARLQIGQPLTLHRRAVDVVAIATQVIQEYRQTTPEIRVDLQTSLPSLVGNWDQSRLERVLSNVVGNAVKYSRPGEPVAVAISPASESHPSAETHADSWAVVEVRDHGLGIPADEQPYIFELYRRGANVARAIPGSGVGLAVARYIVQQHGGTIDVASQEGHGTTVTIRLPL
jgi:PAS domain S-box-containing protein